MADTDNTDFQVPDKFRSAIWASEGGPGTGLNKWGYAGAYQFGTSALKDAGLYQPADGEDLSKNQWKGQITVPGYAPMDVNGFIKNQSAQDAAFNQHMHNLAGYAHDMGLDKYIGQTVGGVPITQETLASMMHFAGPGGTQKFLTSGGSYNPGDGNNVSLAAYGGHIHNYMTGLPTVHVASNSAPTDGTVPPLHIPPPTPMPAPSPSATIDPQLAQLQRLAMLNKLMPAQQATPNYAAAANNASPTAWANALLASGQQTNPLQTLQQVQALRYLQNGGSLLG